MKQYEYKIADIGVSMGFDEKKKVREAEEQWNALGREGWQFCAQVNGGLVFMREIQDES